MVSTAPQDEGSSSEVATTPTLTQPSTTDPEVTMEVTMKGTEPTPSPSEVLFQILSELRDFRKEFKERSSPEETAGLTRPPASAIQVGNEYIQGGLSHPLPSIPPQEPHPIPHPGVGRDNSMPGQYPDNPPTEERASEVYQHLLDVEKAKLASHYDGEIKRLLDEIEAKKELWEASRQKNVDLSLQLTEKSTKVINLQKMMARAGRNDNTAIDGDITAQFVELKIDILQMVKNHLIYTPEKSPHAGASPDLAELYLRKRVAMALYEKFFSRYAMPFGYGDHLLEKNSMRKFEETLRENHCDESAIKEWRVATVKACKLLNRDSAEYAAVVSDQIWDETLSSYHKGYWKRDAAARKDLDSLCKKAADLAILFRGSTIEYEWEQDTSRLESLVVNPKDHEIAGTRGPQPNENSSYEIAYIVFGGVVRGDKSTGLLKNSRMRLSKSHVVIGRLKS